MFKFRAQAKDMQCPCSVPPKMWWLQKVVKKGEEGAEQNGKNDKNNSPIFIFRVIIENWGDLEKNDPKITITRKIKIAEI